MKPNVHLEPAPRVVPNPPAIATALGCIVAAAVLAPVLFGRSSAFVFGLLIVGTIVAGAIWGLTRLFKGECPTCGTTSPLLWPKANASYSCRGCGSYLRTESGNVVPTAADAVEATPTFAAHCPQRIVWPKGCCKCGGEVTRQEKIDLELKEDAPMATDLLTRAATLGTFRLVSKRRFQVEVPHCERCRGGADLSNDYDEDLVVIRICSRAFAESFQSINELVSWDSWVEGDAAA
ncbi:MAG: hypothetical protein KC561_08935 [Myxococcales bacterium]|nr:hypothetical protein [Myxococcales bacterium]